jgi:uncharacterized membrane protein
MTCKIEGIVARAVIVPLLCSALVAQVQRGAQSPAKTKAYRFDTVDYPGAFISDVLDVNTADKKAVGVFYTHSSSDGGTAFTFKGSTYTILHVPGAVWSGLWGINRSDEMVGYEVDSQNRYHGFLDSGGTFTFLDNPGAEFTFSLGINDAGLVVGEYGDSAGFHGFLYDHDHETYSAIDYPGANVGTWASGINSAGEIVGQWEYFDGSLTHQHGFLLKGGTFTSLDFPGALGTNAVGINDAGEIAGSYADANNVFHGFIYSGGIWKTVDVPGAKNSGLTRINNNGQLAGQFYDAFAEEHGIIAH